MFTSRKSAPDASVAAVFGQADAARVLLEHGAADLALDDENKAGALSWAAFFGRPDVR
jgi:ankyrin repeat protein